MMLDWNAYKSELLKTIPEFGKLSPDSVKGYQTLSAANSKDSHLGEKARQLISLAVAVTTRCDGCIVFHSEAALKADASREEISEALGVAMAMNAGAPSSIRCVPWTPSPRFGLRNSNLRSAAI